MSATHPREGGDPGTGHNGVNPEGSERHSPQRGRDPGTGHNGVKPEGSGAK